MLCVRLKPVGKMALLLLSCSFLSSFKQVRASTVSSTHLSFEGHVCALPGHSQKNTIYLTYFEVDLCVHALSSTKIIGHFSAQWGAVHPGKQQPYLLLSAHTYTSTAVSVVACSM